MKKYIEIYDYYKSLIKTGQLKSGDKLPSVRHAAELHEVSKTTIQNAYFDLQADGYILSVEKSGYFVTEINVNESRENESTPKKESAEFNFKSGDADSEAFDFQIWQRYIKSAFRKEERLLSYSDVQGEYDLREALSEYIRQKRNVIASPDRIVIGAGIQALLSIAASLLKGKHTVSFPNESFTQGVGLFRDYNYDVHFRDKDAQVIYVCPSHMTSYGDVMPIKRRNELVKYSKKNKSIVIEDDFDSDFLYNTKPVPALYALSSGENVIYIGSFSNVLIPGIRVSFMVLTKELSEKFRKTSERYAQTASKTEQIALCGYIRDGHIMSQTRKIRRHYTAKTKLLLGEIKKQLPNAKAEISENKIQVKLKAKFSGDRSIFKKNGIEVQIDKIKDGEIFLALSPSSIESSKIPLAVSRLAKCLNG